jgi:trk system potassium uptake protein
MRPIVRGPFVHTRGDTLELRLKGTGMKAVIMGCGRVGARVAGALSADHEVTVIDWNPASFERLGAEFMGETIVGNGIDIDVLRSASVTEADIFLALTDGDNRNLMAAQVARSLGAGRVVARVYDATRSEIFDEAGVVTFSPTITGARRLFDLVIGSGEAG